jgi:sarcosine oxidase/L-pipecolate oxidase
MVSLKSGIEEQSNLHVNPSKKLILYLRGNRYTNPVVQADGKERSTPITRWTTDATITAVPLTALRVIKKFVAQNLPELNEHNIPIIKSRLCWYNDSFDNHLVVDRVPSRKNLMVATGGSGHGFKYLPVLGKWIVDIIEGKELVGAEREIQRRWQWRSLQKGQRPYNIIAEGKKSERTLAKQVLVKDEDLMSGGLFLSSRL